MKKTKRLSILHGRTFGEKSIFVLFFVFLFASFLAVLQVTWLEIKPSHNFTLCNLIDDSSLGGCDPYEKGDRIKVNKAAYEPGESIQVQVRYCSKKDQYVEFNFILKDGIRVDGITKVLSVYDVYDETISKDIEDCMGMLWLEVLDVPEIAYSSTYHIEGFVTYEENPYNTERIEILSEEFEIVNRNDYVDSQYDPGVY